LVPARDACILGATLVAYCHSGGMKRVGESVLAFLDLGRRERQILEALFRLGRGTVAEVRRELPDPPSYSAVRTMLGKLERKGLVAHVQKGPGYVYRALASRKLAQSSTLRRLVRNLYDDSTERAMTALLDMGARRLTPEELERLASKIEGLRREENQ